MAVRTKFHKDLTGDELHIPKIHASSHIGGSDDILSSLGITVNSQVITFTNFGITPSLPPLTDYQIANKKYVDDSISSITGKVNVDQTIPQTLIGTFNFPAITTAGGILDTRSPDNGNQMILGWFNDTFGNQNCILSYGQFSFPFYKSLDFILYSTTFLKLERSLTLGSQLTFGTKTRWTGGSSFTNYYTSFNASSSQSVDIDYTWPITNADGYLKNTSGQLSWESISSTDDLSEGIINLYDKTVTLSEGSNITITGAYPNFTISSSGSGGTTDHASLTNLIWSGAGHIFDSDLNIGQYKIVLSNSSSPSTPPLNNIYLYSKVSDQSGITASRLFYMGDDGSEIEVGSGGGGGGAVSSVFGRVGSISAETNDYTWAQINKSISDIADLTTKSHTSLSDIGTNSHDTIDLHIGSTSNPHSVTASQAGAVALTGNETIYGTKTFDSIPICNTSPTLDSHLVNLAYVQSYAQGLLPKNSCRLTTVSSISTLSGNLSIDGKTTVAGDRILVKNHTNPVLNGIYIAAIGSWSRATDYDESTEVGAGTFTYIIDGNTMFNTQWVQYEIDPEINVDPLNFRALPSPTEYTATNGLTLTGLNFKLGGTLSENTTITQGNYNYTHNLDSTGDFIVQDSGVNRFVVDDGGKVSIGADPVSLYQTYIKPQGDTYKGLVLRPYSATQTGNLLEWQTSAGTAVGYINPSGNYYWARTLDSVATADISMRVAQTPSTLVSSTTTGTDITVSTQYVAYKFTTPASTTYIRQLMMYPKVDVAASNATGSWTAYLYSNDGGSPSKPNALLATGTAIRWGALTTSYAANYWNISYDATASTTYWIVLKWSAAPTGSTLSLRGTTGTNTLATSTDGSTWTNANYQPQYYIYGRTTYAGYFSSGTSYGVRGSSTSGYGGYFDSNNGNAVYAISPYGYGINAQSTYNYAGFFSSTYGTALYGVSSGGGYGIYGNSSTGTAIYGVTTSGYGITATTVTGTAIFAQTDSGSGIYCLCNSSTGNSAQELLRLRRTTTGTPAAGLGTYIDWEIENDNTTPTASRWYVRWNDTTAGTSDAYITIQTTVNGSLLDRFGINPDGYTEIIGNNTGAISNTVLRFKDTDTSSQLDQPIGKIEFYSSDATSPGAGVKAYILGASEGTAPGAYISFATDTTTGTPSERMRITSDGTVKLNKYTTDGFVKFSSSNGTLSVDTSTYLTSLSGALLANGSVALTADWNAGSYDITTTGQINTDITTTTSYFHRIGSTGVNLPVLTVGSSYPNNIGLFYSASFAPSSFLELSVNGYLGSYDNYIKLGYTGSTLDETNKYIYLYKQVVASSSTTASNFISNISVGTQPYACISTTLNTNLNADLLDGLHSSSFSLTTHTHSLDNLTDVVVNSGLSDGQVLTWDSGDGIWRNITPSEGTTDHSLLDNLDYISSGHTGFSPSSHTHALDNLSDIAVSSGLNDEDILMYDIDTSYWKNYKLNTNYLKIDGSNANQDIDIGSYDLTATNLFATTIYSGTATPIWDEYHLFDGDYTITGSGLVQLSGIRSQLIVNTSTDSWEIDGIHSTIRGNADINYGIAKGAYHLVYLADGSGTYVYGTDSDVDCYATISNKITGHNINVNLQGDGDYDTYGINQYLSFGGTATTAGNYYGVNTWLDTNNDNVTINNAYGEYIYPRKRKGTWINSYGIYIRDVTQGTTLNYAIYTGLGDVRFGDDVTATYYTSNVAIGTSPYSCTSTTLNTNLNADMLDGYHSNNLPYVATETDPIYSANTYATSMNQGVATTDNPSFIGINLVNNNTTISSGQTYLDDVYYPYLSFTDYGGTGYLYYQSGSWIFGSYIDAMWVYQNVSAGCITAQYGFYGDGTSLTGVLHAEADTLDTVAGRGGYTTALCQFQNAAGLEVGKDAATNTAGVIKFWSAGANNYYNTFTAGTNTANATYTLPTAMPASTGFLKSSNAGVLSWDTSTYYKSADSPTFGTITTTGNIELGNASDTTIARVSAGVVSVEGKNIYLATGTDVALADGGTGASLADPNADRIFFWDDSAGASTWLACGNSVAITTTTLDTIQDIRTSATPQFAKLGLGVATSASELLKISATDVNGAYNILANNTEGSTTRYTLKNALTTTYGTTSYIHDSIYGTFNFLDFGTTTLTDGSGINLYGNHNLLTLTNLTLGGSGDGANGVTCLGSDGYINGTLVLNDTNPTDSNDVSLYGLHGYVYPTITQTAGSGSIVAVGVLGNASPTTTNDANHSTTLYGVQGTSVSSLGTAGAATKYGGYFSTSGTADTNYGIYAQAVGATANYSGYFYGSPFYATYSNSSTSTAIGYFANLYNNYDANPTVAYPILALTRAGKTTSSYGNAAFFGISRYENVSTNSRTQMDIQLAHAGTSTPDVTVMSLRSSGAVGIGTTQPTELLSLASSAKIGWEASAGTVDTNLYRNGSNALKTDDSFQANSFISSDGTAGIDTSGSFVDYYGQTWTYEFKDGLCTTFQPGSAVCPRVDGWYAGKWIQLGRAIKHKNGKDKDGRWDIELNVPIQKFRLVEDEAEISHVHKIIGDGEEWKLGEVITSPASKFGATDGSTHEFEFSKPVTKLETYGYYILITAKESAR